MRIMDGSGKVEIDDVLLLLTPEEVEELIMTLQQLNPNKGDHFHISDSNYVREITVAVYTKDNLHFFNDNIRALLDV